MLKVDSISKTYGKQIALADVSFSLKPGEILGFLGPNGAGKTTTMKILTGFLTPDSGTVHYDKKNLQTNYKEISARIGYLPENNPLYGNWRVDEFIRYFSALKGGDSQTNLEELVEKCGLSDVLDKRIETLSKGYKQRVGLAKALLHDPEYLVLDEPTTGLDPNQKDEILALIKDISKEKAILFSSHILSEVKEIASRLIIINRGQIAAQGSVEALTAKHSGMRQIRLVTNAPLKELKAALAKVKVVTKLTPASAKADKVLKESYREFLLEVTDEKVGAVEVFETVVKKKWKLLKLAPESFDLDDLFRQLTT